MVETNLIEDIEEKLSSMTNSAQCSDSMYLVDEKTAPKNEAVYDTNTTWIIGLE